MSTSATAAIPRPESFYQFQAPPLDLTTSVVTKSILLGRQLMLLPFMPLMKSRPEQPLDGEKLKVPLEELEHAFVHHQLLEQGTVYGEDETFPLPRIHIDDVEPAQLQRLIFHTPVIIEGMIDKDMLQRWSLERLKQRFGDASHDFVFDMGSGAQAVDAGCADHNDRSCRGHEFDQAERHATPIVPAGRSSARPHVTIQVRPYRTYLTA